jgi:LPXTG-motif cell wall-anchored protein
MSLARAFMYSGCPSVVTSLWSVDDKSTSEVMRHFYQQIKDGKTKDEALHEAKLNYLDGKGIEASHPFYWSGFVHIGNTEPLFGNDSSINYWYLVGLGLILLLIGFYFTRKK